MNYCSRCGSRIDIQVPEGDNRPRHVCSSPECGFIHYQNPRIITGCIPVSGDKVLLCRRAIQPRYGLWTLPAGFLENGETVAQGAARETREEAGADVNIERMFSMFTLTHIDQVYMIFLAQLTSNYSAGEESLEVALFDEGEIPWNEMAFPVMTETLQRYYADRKNGEMKTHVGEMRVAVVNDKRYYDTLMLEEDEKR